MHAAFLLVLLIGSAVRAGEDDVNAATNAADAFSDYAGTVEAIQTHLTRPLLSENDLRTPDGTAFSAQLMCQAQDSFLEVLVTPSATGDIGTIRIQQDTTLDGAYDRLYTPPTHASGVCANGLIACTPGTWSDCRHYRWTADAANRLGLVETGLGQLGGCYCLNNYCGAGLLAGNLQSVVAAIGGGAAGALANQNPYYAITSVRIDGPTAVYSGQNTADCGAAGPSTLSDYFDDSLMLAEDATATAAENDAYQLMVASPAATQSDLTAVSCDVRRTISMDETNLDDIIDYDAGAGSISPCGPDCLQLVLGTIGDNYWGPVDCAVFEHNVRFNVLRPERILSAALTRAVWDDWIQVRANSDLIWSGPQPWAGGGLPPGACELGTSWDETMSADFSASLRAGGLVDFNIRVAVAGNGEGYAYARVTADTECRLGDEIVLDGCAALQADSDCALQSETVDGVDTVRDFAATGLTPLPSTVTVAGAACREDVTRDWWEKTRDYQCSGGGDYDFSEAMARKALIHATATPTDYQDQIIDPETGVVTVVPGDLVLLDELPVAPCVPACKTRRPRPRNDVGRSGVVSDQNTVPDTFDVIYHECGADNVCPLSDGEEIVTDCRCLDEFAEASVVMQLIRQGGQDILCSSGIPQEPQ